MLSGVDLQRQTLRLYGELMARRDSWAGHLVFACGAAASTTGLPAAVSIAGGTSLILDPDAAAVKSVFRQGGVDFVVNTVDEALRVLKNEIRKQRPLSVALSAAQGPAFEELMKRGVVPDLYVRFDASPDYPVATTLDVATDRAHLVPSEALRSWLAEQDWFEAVLERATMAEMRVLEAHLLERITDSVRRPWLQRIGHYQRVTAGGSRVIWLTEAERDAVTRSLAGQL